MVSKITPKALLNKELILFDMDGTLLNSEGLHFKALIEVLELDERFDWTPYIGMADEVVIKRLKPELNDQDIHSLCREKNQRLIKQLASLPKAELEQRLTLGVRDLLLYLKSRSRLVALVSASEEEVVHEIVEQLGMRSLFVNLYAHNATDLTKPSPSPYLKAMRDHLVAGHDTLIFEDSLTGLEAALSSGAHVIRVTAHAPPESLHRFHDLHSIDQFSWLIEHIR